MGLGVAGSVIDFSGATRKERLRQKAIQRFNRLNETAGTNSKGGGEDGGSWLGYI